MAASASTPDLNTVRVALFTDILPPLAPIDGLLIFSTWNYRELQEQVLGQKLRRCHRRHRRLGKLRMME